MGLDQRTYKYLTCVVPLTCVVLHILEGREKEEHSLHIAKEALYGNEMQCAL